MRRYRIYRYKHALPPLNAKKGVVIQLRNRDYTLIARVDAENLRAVLDFTQHAGWEKHEGVQSALTDEQHLPALKDHDVIEENLGGPTHYLYRGNLYRAAFAR
jgi:hypothetical protein